jgi:hypothetical protein
MVRADLGYKWSLVQIQSPRLKPAASLRNQRAAGYFVALVAYKLSPDSRRFAVAGNSLESRGLRRRRAIDASSSDTRSDSAVFTGSEHWPKAHILRSAAGSSAHSLQSYGPGARPRAHCVRSARRPSDPVCRTGSLPRTNSALPPGAYGAACPPARSPAGSGTRSLTLASTNLGVSSRS